LFFVIISLNLIFSRNKDKKIKNLLITAVISATIVAVYAILQFFGYDFLIWEEPAVITKRAMSTLGQPNFLGSFLLLTLPLPLYLFDRGKNLSIKIFWIFSFALQLLAIIFSGSRGAWMGLIGVTLLFLIVFYYQKNKKIFFSGLGAIIVLVLVLMFGHNTISQRFQSAFDVSQGSTSVRASIWSASLKSLSGKDWGYGLENQKEAIWTYYQTDWAVFSKVNVIFDRAHNLFLDIVLTVGLIGLFLWICFYYFILKTSFNNIVFDRDPLLSLILFWSLASYLISLFFNFSVVATMVYFWLISAIIIAINHTDDFKDFGWGDDYEKNITIKKIFVLIVLFLCLMGVWREIKNLSVDYYFLKTKQFFYQQEIPASTLTFSYLRAENPVYYEYYYDFIDMVFNNFGKFKDLTSKEMAMGEIRAISEIIENDNRNKSFQHNLARAQALALLGNFSEAEKIFNELEIKSPYYPNIYYKKAKMRILQSDFSSAENYFRKTLSLLPPDYSLNSEINLKALQNYKLLVNKELKALDEGDNLNN
jgi:putative inorganic carbon (HCO3(-)) transporter